jgi:gamma-glutamyltranspeptidase / glutathione hydrolase
MLVCAVATSGCSTVGSVFGGSGQAEGTPGHITGFLGGVVADEPQAVLAAREILSAGGNAADAAVALGFALSVTLPSRAGLGGGGACLAYKSGKSGTPVPDAIMFLPAAPASSAGASRPAAVPMLARGLYALYARHGSRPFESLMAPAERMARLGVVASRAFTSDLALVAGPLSADPGAASVFFRGSQPIVEGTTMVQPDLGSTLAQIRVSGVGDFYQGGLARRMAEAADRAGASLTAADFRQALPTAVQPLVLPVRGGDSVAFLPPPADGGLAAAVAYQALIADPAAVDRANARGLAAAARWRQGGIDAQAILNSTELPGASLPALPASSTFATLDKDGNAVVCAVTMGNLFGTGRMAENTGMLLAASPTATPPALLSAGMLYNANLKAFHAAVGGSGQAGAPLAVAIGLAETVRDRSSVARPNPGAVPDPGRANIIACNAYLPSEEGSCGWATDPRGAGLAIGSN